MCIPNNLCIDSNMSAPNTSMPPEHHDAVGYIQDLANEENSGWFRYLCDAAIEQANGVLSAFDYANLHPLLFGKASYLSRNAVASGTVVKVPTVDHLQEIGSFTSFKRLGPSLRLSFPQRINIIFGTNGSGKSSICEALKVLADASAPARPLHNVTVSPPGVPSFSYQLQSSTTPALWNSTLGYGRCSEKIKYFDSSLASRSLVQNVDPGTVISIVPFHLASFNRLREMTVGFRNHCQKRKDLNLKFLEADIGKVQELFRDYQNTTLATLTIDEALELDDLIKEAQNFKDQETLSNLLKKIETLEKGVTEEGLKLLKTEVRELAKGSKLLSSFIVGVQTLWCLDISNIDKQIATKIDARRELNMVVAGSESPPDIFTAFLEYAASKCNFEHPETETCPLCQQFLQKEAQELFRNYHEYVSGQIAQDIRNLKEQRKVAGEYAGFLSNLHVPTILESSVIDASILTKLGKLFEAFFPFCASNIPSADAVEELKEICAELGDALIVKSESLETLLAGRAESEKELKRLWEKAKPLQIVEICASNLKLICNVHKRAKIDYTWGEKIAGFPALLRKVTAKSKLAHEELIVTDFETKLDAEYLALTNRTLEDFGVKLQRQGRESSVTVVPNISGSSLSDVLSEGEQRVHSLALFFAELETCDQSVIVFDDPVSSFDYNYITSYCRRLRKFLFDRPDRQVLVLTHNWEFFVQLQVTINKAQLNNHLSVQVLENCCTSATYSEKIDDLKRVIDRGLATPTEPSNDDKETLAGCMRRLIEAIVNTHVFANQRHQYKQKTLAVSTFGEFTKVVALEPTEAQKLSDLYSDLSITEHDDPRSAYVNIDRATFITRYEQIKTIEHAIIARKIL